MRTSGATPLSRIAPQQEGTFGSIANARFQLLNMISSHAVTFRLPSLWKPLTDIAAGAVLQSNKRSKEAHDVLVREKGRSCTPIYPEAGHRLMAIFSREYPHAVSSRPNALSKTPSRRLLQGPFFSASAVPGGQRSAVEGPELRPRVHPDAGR